MDEELRTALTAFLRAWLRPEWLAENGEEDFEQLLNVTANGSIGSVFRSFHAEYGRYPTYVEMCPPNRPIVTNLPDLE